MEGAKSFCQFIILSNNNVPNFYFINCIFAKLSFYQLPLWQIIILLTAIMANYHFINCHFAHDDLINCIFAKLSYY
jgi:hypothetical protein